MRGQSTIELTYTEPFDGRELIAYLAGRVVPGVEQVTGGTYTRSLRLPGGGATVMLEPAPRHVRATFDLDDERDLPVATERVRALLDLAADPAAVTGALGRDPVLGPLVHAVPGRRVPGSVDGPELAVRAVLGQQISLAGAATAAGRLVAAHGESLRRPVGAVTHLFPSAAALAAADPASFRMPGSRARCVIALSAALAAGDVVLQAGGDRPRIRMQLLALPGIGPWTVEYVAMRALHDPDAFPATDLGIRRALERHGLDGSPRAAAQHAEVWRPFRAYAVIHLWAELASRA